MIELVESISRDGPDVPYIHIHVYVNYALQNGNNSEQLKCLKIFNFHIHDLCQNIYLSIPYTSIRYACLNKLFLKLKKNTLPIVLSFFFISGANSRLHGPLTYSSHINPLHFVARRSMAC